MDYLRQLTKKENRLTTAAAVASTALIAASGWVYLDYRAWLNFGTGGTPPDFAGYRRMNKIRWAFWQTGDDLRDASSLGSEGPTYLTRASNPLPAKLLLPKRLGERPRIMPRTLPQRQVPYTEIDPAVRARVHALVKKYADRAPQLLRVDLSATEGKSTDAIYARDGLAGRPASAQDRILGSEIAHAHPADDSLHVWLSEADARLVVEQGWGEKFPLGSLGWTHKGWTFLYAPRTMQDVESIEKIVEAAIAYVTGKMI